MASNDPEFERKAADIWPVHKSPAAVFCYEKTALDRLDPVLPLSPGRASGTGLNIIGTERHAALNVKTGRVEGKAAKLMPVPNRVPDRVNDQVGSRDSVSSCAVPLCPLDSVQSRAIQLGS